MAKGAAGERRVALVTGASRGIGKACAIHLARAGFDVALLARTVDEGEAREHSSTVARSDTTPLPGSLSTTAGLIEAEGRRALTVAGDLLDRASIGFAVTTVLERWGRVDVLLNNGRYIGPGHMDPLLATPLDLFDKHFEANVIAPLALTRLVLPGMIERGSGLVANMTSSVATMDPPGPIGAGGWGLGYAVSKGALHRVAGVLAHEVGDSGVRVVNVDPGFVATERMAIDMGKFGFDLSGASPDVVGAAFAWLATDDHAASYHGGIFPAQDICRDLDLLTAR
jgi:NAD(P)-dependent dehydrogenase (short-subunit alcohol dehydrogenase family)